MLKEVFIIKFKEKVEKAKEVLKIDGLTKTFMSQALEDGTDEHTSLTIATRHWAIDLVMLSKQTGRSVGAIFAILEQRLQIEAGHLFW